MHDLLIYLINLITDHLIGITWVDGVRSTNGVETRKTRTCETEKELGHSFDGLSLQLNSLNFTVRRVDSLALLSL